MTKIKELIEDFRLNQEILGREKRYVELCLFRLYRWEEFTVKVLGVTETEECDTASYQEIYTGASACRK